MGTQMFYRTVTYSQSAEDDRGFTYAHPDRAGIDDFCRTTTEWANQQGLRIVSITAVNGAIGKFVRGRIDKTFMGYGAATVTVGFLVVTEPA